jgi:hypothetical protein
MKFQPCHPDGSIRTFLATLGFIALLALPAIGQVPTIISYQGRVLMNNTNFNGTGQFKFAFVNASGTIRYWVNSVDGNVDGQPDTAVSLGVSNGLVMTLLGDVTIPNMLSIPASVFNNSAVYLRVWFDGGAGLQQLAPDQRVVSVGYAMMSANVPDATLTASKLAPGVLHPTNFPANSVTSAQLADDVDLGTNNVNGRLDVYRTTAGTPAITLLGNGSQISTYGADGLEQTRLWGISYGELLLNNSLANNATAVRLTAQGTTGGQLELRNTNGSNRAVLEGENVGGTLTLYQGDGNVGAILYGNDSGSGALSLRNTNGSARLRAFGGPLSGSLNLYNAAGGLAADIYCYADDEGTISVRNSGGAQTVYLWGRDSDGTGDGQLGLKKASGIETITMQAGEGAGGAQMLMRNAAGQQTVQLDSDASGVACGYLALYRSNGVANIILDSNDGTVQGQVIEITGGSDFSEKFDIRGEHLEPGMIVSIDPKNPGRLALCDSAHDKKVAGIVSGAGGVKPGMLMGQRGSVADGKHPVALSGRVYCWVDADANGAIEPGDMLTTSKTTGHGMKVTDHTRATGAIVGKAMTSLAKGKGLVLVLVNLQ